MANTIAVDSNWENLTGKTLSIQSELTSKLKTAVIDITAGCSDTYATNGVTVDLSLGGRISTVIEVSIISNDGGLLLQYVPAAGNAAATGKIKAYGTDPGATGGAVAAFSELPNSSADWNGIGIKVRVVGY